MATLTLESPTELLQYELRTALTMFTHHAGETKDLIANLRKLFKILDLRDTTAPSPSTTGITRQAESVIAKSGSKLRENLDREVHTSEEPRTMLLKVVR